MTFNDALQARCLLHCLSVSDLISALTKPTRILTRNSPLLPYEAGFLPEPGTENLGEWDGTEYPGLWFPPATISYEEVDDEAYGVQRTNPLAQTLQVLRVPTSSRCLWGELVPFLLLACPALKTLGTASASMYGLELMDGLGETSVLEEIFLHLDQLSPEDSLLPGYTRLGHGATLSHNSPSLRFIVQNFGPTAFEPVLESDDQATVIRKEFALEVWDQAKLFTPCTETGTRMERYLDLLARRAPHTRSLHMLALSRSPGMAFTRWDRLQDLSCLTQLTLQIPYLAEYAGLFGVIGETEEGVRDRSDWGEGGGRGGLGGGAGLGGARSSVCL